MSEPDRGWLAGIVEGEGAIMLRQGKYPSVAVYMTDEDVVRRCREVSGVGFVTGPVVRPNARWKNGWRWQVTNSPEAVDLLLALLPWLGQRRGAVAKRVIATYDARRAAA